MEASMKIREWMKTDLVTISKGRTLEDAIILLIEKKVGTLPVVEPDGRLLGLVTMKYILKYFLPDFFQLLGNTDFIEDFGALEIPTEELSAILSKEITEVMDRNPPIISLNSSVLCAANMMMRHKLNDLLIVENGTLKGLVSTVDLGVAILQWLRQSAAQASPTLVQAQQDRQEKA
jgi:CBS domain-containing protein